MKVSLNNGEEKTLSEMKKSDQYDITYHKTKLKEAKRKMKILNTITYED